jgi:hypothetical protein
MPSLRPLQYRTDAACTVQTILPGGGHQLEFERQLELLVNQFKSYPSIIAWVCRMVALSSFASKHSSQVIYNEGWGQITHYYPEFELTERVKKLDPSRLVDATSGWKDHGAGDFSVSNCYHEPHEARQV